MIDRLTILYPTRYANWKSFIGIKPHLVAYSLRKPLRVLITPEYHSAITLKQKLTYAGNAYFHRPDWDTPDLPHFDFVTWWPMTQVRFTPAHQIEICPRNVSFRPDPIAAPQAPQVLPTPPTPVGEHIPAYAFDDLKTFLEQLEPNTQTKVYTRLTEANIAELEFEFPGITIVQDPQNHDLYHIL